MIRNNRDILQYLENTICIGLLVVSACGANKDVQPQIVPENSLALCNDGVDNDWDNRIDCDDPDCDEMSVCSSTSSVAKPSGSSSPAKASTSSKAEKPNSSTGKVKDPDRMQLARSIEPKSATSSSAVKAAKTTPKPVIVLKLDDVTRVSQGFEQSIGFLKREGVKAGLGIIGYSLEKDDPKLIAWIKALHKSGQFEFWNHGYKKRTAFEDKGEFESESAEEQRKALLKTQNLAKEKLGITLTTFGPHFSHTNKHTEEALKQVPEIKSVFFYTNPKTGPWFVFKRVMGLEHRGFDPNADIFIEQYRSRGVKEPVLALQGHPEAWTNSERMEEFQKIILFLKKEGCRFMTPSEYVDSIDQK